MEVFTRLVEILSVDSKIFGGVKRDDCRMANLQVSHILILMLLFAKKGFSHYPGSVLNHVHQKCILKYKALILCWIVGRFKFVLDFSLHGEKGKTEGKEQGLRAH